MPKERIIIPTEEEILRIHNYLVEAHGGIQGTHTSPSYVPSFCENYLSDSGIVPVTAFMLSRLSKGHYFVDGNKRTAYFASRYAALRNGHDFNGRSPNDVVSEMEKLAELDDKSSRELAERFVERDLINSGCSFKNLAQFERLVLKSIAVSTKLSDS